MLQYWSDFVKMKTFVRQKCVGVKSFVKSPIGSISWVKIVQKSMCLRLMNRAIEILKGRMPGVLFIWIFVQSLAQRQSRHHQRCASSSTSLCDGGGFLKSLVWTISIYYFIMIKNTGIGFYKCIVFLISGKESFVHNLL